ncbi:uncharacterized protein TRUGW13939_00341 [Talaromyces rugulosus]|uniref:FAD dependent oxidoreductase domain-containing protein n=1 Tax=Talaromyces rugulosus TaxID=121627 RepID=A0A7H8QIK5_TALRU|nr:uncharacterized protein TRUGW13939_00341 [Talaromyces rugulosus]QKX53265.1 hypothetical protein TRUGW13939_00341 [Talaromyces rugulosus]
MTATNGVSKAPGCIPAPNPGQTFWQQDGNIEFSDYRSTETLPEQTDILIIGAGYAGTSTAYHLLAEGTKNSITILEARGVCSGATGRNGGHLRPDLYGHIPTYIERAGLEAAVEIAEFEIAHVPAMKKFIREQGIDCDFNLCRSIDVWCNEQSAQNAKTVYGQMVAHGLSYMEDVVFYTGKEAEGISGVKGAKACASYTAASMSPYKFIIHLTKLILASEQVNLQTHTPAVSILPDPSGGYTVDTSRGKIHADTIIHANNAYVSGLLPEYEKNIIPCKGIACHIAVPDGTKAPLLNNSYINRTEDNTLSYLIGRNDGGIVVGGAAAKFKPFKYQWYNNVDDSILIDAAKDYYNDYMQRTYHGWDNSGAAVRQIWSGVMGYSYDSHPHIGSVPNKPGQYINAGFNGHGMPVIWLSAKGLAKMIAHGAPFEKCGIPRLFQTSQLRIDRAQNGTEGKGDILGTASFGATKQ